MRAIKCINDVITLLLRIALLIIVILGIGVIRNDRIIEIRIDNLFSDIQKINELIDSELEYLDSQTEYYVYQLQEYRKYREAWNY